MSLSEPHTSRNCIWFDSVNVQFSVYAQTVCDNFDATATVAAALFIIFII